MLNPYSNSVYENLKQKYLEVELEIKANPQSDPHPKL
jgi:hypothetical protein